jgi:hypothetical protein
MRRKIRVAGFLFATVAWAAGFAEPGFADNHLHVFLGGKVLDEKDWAPTDVHRALGVALAFGPKSWPVKIAVDGLASDSGSEMLADPELGNVRVALETREAHVGVRKYLETTRVIPYVGGGLAWAQVRSRAALADGRTGSLSDSSVGYWLGLGMLWRVGARYELGFDFRFSSVDVDFAGFEVGAGGSTLSFINGFRF